MPLKRYPEGGFLHHSQYIYAPGGLREIEFPTVFLAMERGTVFFTQE
jgi:hypothetical protein